MRLLLLLTLLPAFSWADCLIELDEVKPSVNQTLLPLFEKDNSDITKQEFITAEAEISKIISNLDVCEDYSRKYEYENYHFKRWGEKSDRYNSYSLWLTSVDMQLEAAIDSFDFWIFRSWLFDIDMWEKVAQEFDAREI